MKLGKITISFIELKCEGFKPELRTIGIGGIFKKDGGMVICLWAHGIKIDW